MGALKPDRPVVYVITDLAFGERLRAVPQDIPVWVVESDCNDFIARSLWAADPKSLLTVFTPKRQASRNEQFLSVIEAVELHHGHFSSQTPYLILEVLGTPMTEAIRGALEALGFSQFTSDGDGFSARRSDVEARRLRA